MNRVVERSAVAGIARKARDAGRRIVFTNGCFDLLHRGHVEYLEEARALGDLLIVGLNTDASVSRLKGLGRPVVPLEDRAVVLAALRSVDYVVDFEEDTPLNLIREVNPHVLVKGGDYRKADIVGADWVESNGGQVLVLKEVEGRSTSGLMARRADGGPGPRT